MTFSVPRHRAKPPPRCVQAEERSRQYEGKLSVIMKTEELHGGQRRNVNREADNLYKKLGKTCKAVRAGVIFK